MKLLLLKNPQSPKMSKNKVIIMSQQQDLTKYLLRQDVIDNLISEREETSREATEYANRLMELAEVQDSEHNMLDDPFDRSVAIVFQLVRNEDLDPWNIDLSAFIALFGARIKEEADSVDLPACGRLIRLAWEVLRGQANELLERQNRLDQLEEPEEFTEWGWATDFDEDEFTFTNNLITGELDTELPTLFHERIRRDEGRPVTLAELLTALRDACDDAEALKLKEENRILYQKELKDALANVGSRMHDEDLESDIKYCWNAMKDASNSGKPVLLKDVSNKLLEKYKHETNENEELLFDEANITSFVSTLFLTHRGYAEIWQEEVPNGPVYVKDLWPKINDWVEVNDAVKAKESFPIQKRAKNYSQKENEEKDGDLSIEIMIKEDS